MEPDAALASELLSLQDHEEYLEAASTLLLKLFPGENVAWNVLDAQHARALVRAYPEAPLPDAVMGQNLVALWKDHPAVLSYLHDTNDQIWLPRRLSDLVTDAQLYVTRAYQEGLAPLGLNRQLSLLIARPSPLSVRGWALNRSCQDFTDEEVELAKYLQPVLRILDTIHQEDSDQRWGTTADEFGLTTREQQVLRLLGKGITEKRIAHLLGISPRTVGKHLENTYAKLGCTNRIDALRSLRGQP